MRWPFLLLTVFINTILRIQDFDPDLDSYLSHHLEWETTYASVLSHVVDG